MMALCEHVKTQNNAVEPIMISYRNRKKGYHRVSSSEYVYSHRMKCITYCHPSAVLTRYRLSPVPRINYRLL